MDIEQQKWEAKERLQLYLETVTKTANEVDMEIIKQLIFVGTVLITASFFIFNLSDVKTEISGSFKLIYLISWITIIASIVLGILQLQEESNFHGEWAEATFKVIKKISNEVIRDEADLRRVVSEPEELPRKSSNEFMHFQIASLAIGLVALFIVISKLLGIWP